VRKSGKTEGKKEEGTDIEEKQKGKGEGKREIGGKRSGRGVTQ